jgi:hypothetical protein
MLVYIVFLKYLYIEKNPLEGVSATVLLDNRCRYLGIISIVTPTAILERLQMIIFVGEENNKLMKKEIRQ